MKPRAVLILALIFAGPSALAQRPLPPARSPAPPTAAPQSAPSAPATPKAAPGKRPDGGPFKLDFNKMEIVDVISTISQWTNKNFILTEDVRGKITILSPTPVSAEEAYAAFLAALDANNLSVYPVGKYLKVVNKKASIKNNIPVYENGERYPADERMVTKLIRLKHADPEPIRNILNTFVTRDGEIQVFQPDLLIISDNALNLHRLERITEQLDIPGGQDEIRVLQVSYAAAQELSEKILNVFQAAQRGAPRPPGQPAPAAEGSISKIVPDDRTNKLIIIANAKAFKRIEDLIKQLDVPVPGEGQVHVLPLANANAEDLAQVLSNLASGTPTSGQRRGRGSRTTTPTTPGQPPPPAPPAGVPGGATAALFQGEVKITADKSTNSLVIIADQADFQSIVRVVKKLDIPRRQVFVEAVIMEVALRNVEEWSVGAHGGLVKKVSFGKVSGDAPIVFASEPGQANSLSLASLVSLGGFLAGIQGPAISSASLGVNVPSFGLVLNWLQRDSNVNVLSTPHILTSDNEEAEITVGQNVPFQAGIQPNLGSLTNVAGTAGNLGNLNLSGLLGAGLFAPIQRQNVELRLKIKPQINESDFVRMEIDEQTEEIVEQDPVLGPTTAKRTAKTAIVAKDQQTVVIGGMIQERHVDSSRKVPILGSIPILGRLFRDSETTKIKTNLLLFLTPYIIRDQADFRRIFERKLKERQEFVEKYFGDAAGYAVAVDYARKRGPLAFLMASIDEELRKVENGGPGLEGEQVITPEGPRRGSEAAPPAAPIPLPPGGLAPGEEPPPPAAPPPEFVPPKELPREPPPPPPEEIEP